MGSGMAKGKLWINRRLCFILLYNVPFGPQELLSDLQMLWTPFCPQASTHSIDFPWLPIGCKQRKSITKRKIIKTLLKEGCPSESLINRKESKIYFSVTALGGVQWFCWGISLWLKILQENEMRIIILKYSNYRA